MKILVANLGSTSFKFRLFEMDSETQIARGAIDRIGLGNSNCVFEIGNDEHRETRDVASHADAVQLALNRLVASQHLPIESLAEVDGIGFKAVHGGAISGVQRVDDTVLGEMQSVEKIAPAHNPVYVQAMKEVRSALPSVPLVAAFETGFHQTQAAATQTYAIPYQWSDDLSIRRFGFHGASHRFIAERIAALTKNAGRAVSMHLGGSSSLCAIKNGQSVATTMGMSPQTGLPQSNRVGDFDPFALPLVMEHTGKTLEQVLQTLADESGLLGISGVSGDIRDLQNAAASGNDRAELALEVYVSETRRHLGGMIVSLGGVDCIVFTGGTGENGNQIRQRICAGLSDLGIVLDEQKNENVVGETAIHDADSAVEIWVVPTNEEIVVARQTVECLTSEPAL